MKTELKDYKIRLNGRHQEVWDQMGRLGYNRDNEDVFMLFPFIFLYADKNWGCNKEESYFIEHKYPEISVDDFLRLGWEPKVGDRVKCVDEGSKTYIKNGLCYTIKEVVDIGDRFFLSFNEIDETHSYIPSRFIPLYDSEPVKQEKQDAYINYSLDGLHFNVAIRRDNKTIHEHVHFTNLHTYNILSEADYKAKYHNKKELRFNGWKVTVEGDNIRVGCKIFSKQSISLFAYIANTIEENGTHQLYGALDFINNNKKELGL